MRLKQSKSPWGPGTQYATYEEYWTIEVLAKLVLQYLQLTGEDISEEFGLGVRFDD